MTLEELADLIRANSANTNGRIDGVIGRIDGLVEHVRDLHRGQNETYSALMTIQNDFTDVRGDIKGLRQDMTETKVRVAGIEREIGGMRQSFDLASTVVALRKEVDALAAEVAELRRRAS
jgi:hypothetical protein